VLVVCALLVFVPVGYIYPSRTRAFRTPTLVASGLWLVAYAIIVAQLPNPNPVVLGVSMAYLVYYLGLSLHLEAKRRAARDQVAQPMNSVP